MAAIATVMELFQPGDHLIVDADLYGGTIRLFNHISEKNGISITPVNCSKDDVKACIRENTKAVFIETPTNPMMNITDIKALAEITKANHLLLIVDNTFLSPYLQNPLTLGADIVIYSGTKYLSGHDVPIRKASEATFQTDLERWAFQIQDGYDWAMLYDIEADDGEIEKGLIQNLVSCTDIKCSS